MSARRLVETLVRSTEALERAIDADDLVGLATSLETRCEAFAALRACGAILDPDVRSALAGLTDRDRVIEVKARERLEGARAEIAQLRQVRRALRNSRTEEAPRFVSHRA